MRRRSDQDYGTAPRTSPREGGEDGMRGSTKLVAGLGDAGLAAGGTFLAGIVAVRELPVPALAVYAVVFSAGVLAMLLPRQLHYIPAQIGANLAPGLTSPVILRDVRAAIRSNLMTFVIVVAVALSLVTQAPVQVCLALGVTGAAYSVVSPVQDHIRAALHLVDRHLSAAACSLVTAAVVASGCVAALVNHGAWWIPLVPFGFLFAGNLVAVAVGLRLLRGAALHAAYEQPGLLIRSRFLFAEVAIQAAWFGCNYSILFLLGAPALARLEAARIVASPISILVTALLTFMGPAMLRRLRSTPDHPHGPRRDLLTIFVMLLAGTALYVAVLAVLGGVVATVLDKPYDLGLWIVRVGAVLVEGSAAIAAFLVFSIGRTRTALANSIAAGGIGLGGTILLSFVLGPFALPIGQALGTGFRLMNSVRVVESEVARSARDRVATA